MSWCLLPSFLSRTKTMFPRVQPNQCPADVCRSKTSLLKFSKASYASLLSMELEKYSKYEKYLWIMTKSQLLLGQTNLSPKHFIRRYKQQKWTYNKFITSLQNNLIAIFSSLLRVCSSNLLRYLYLRVIFWADIFMFHSIWWQFSLSEFWNISWVSPFKIFQTWCKRYQKDHCGKKAKWQTSCYWFFNFFKIFFLRIYFNGFLLLRFG